MTESGAAQSPFLRQLTSSDTRTRASALHDLRTYLTGHSKFSQLELLKLWKGLFYSMWHSDRPRTQQLLARDLAGLVDAVGKDNADGFLEAFWFTMAREWGGIDALRMDKFLYLIRLYLRASMQQVVVAGYTEDAMSQYHNLMSTTPLAPFEPKVPDGLRYHILDIYIDELLAVGALREELGGARTALLEPVLNIKNKTRTKHVRKRAQEALQDDRLAHLPGFEHVKTVDSADIDVHDHILVQADGDADTWSGIED